MIRLDLSPGPRWVDLLPGLRLQVAPVTTTIVAAARASGALDALGEDAPREEMAIAMAKVVAHKVVLDWEGVGDDAGAPLAVTHEGIDALLDLWPVFEAFQAQVLGPHLVLDQEKNASAPLPSGTTAGAKTTARPAKGSARTARRK